MADEHKKDVDAYSGVDTTGHEWDGIKELDNPLPRWWVWVFYASIVWSVIYWVFMPAWPALNHPRFLSVCAQVKSSKRCVR